MTNITLDIPEQWDDLLPDKNKDQLPYISLNLCGIKWVELVNEITEKFPKIAERVVSASGGLVEGIAIAINDDIFGSYQIPDKSTSISFNEGDTVSIIIPFAGG